MSPRIHPRCQDCGQHLLPEETLVCSECVEDATRENHGARCIGCGERCSDVMCPKCEAEERAERDDRAAMGVEMIRDESRAYRAAFRRHRA